MKDIQSKKKNIYENRMFFKGYIKICEMAAPIRNNIFLLTVKSVVKKVMTRATPGRSLVLKYFVDALNDNTAIKSFSLI